MWKNVDEELPPCDGRYFVTNNPNLPVCKDGIIEFHGQYLIGLADYDGYGFLDEGHYIEPKFWAPYKVREKKYGKVIKDINY